MATATALTTHPLIEMPHLGMRSGFRNLGEQMFAIRAAAESNGRDIDPRLIEIQRRATSANTPAGASEKIPSEGGFLVAEEFQQELVERLYMTGQILARCTKFTLTSGNVLKLHQFDETSRVNGSRLGGIQAYHEDEAQSLQIINPTTQTYSQKPTFNQLALTMKKLTCLIYLTSELADDSTAFDTWAKLAFAQEMAWMLENDIVNGTGAGQALGVLNAPALITITKQTGQAAATVVSQNVLDMVGVLWAASIPNAVWLYNPQLLPTLMTLTVTVGNGGSELPLWQFATSKTSYNTLCGIEARPSEYCQAPGTAGDLLLVDFSRYAVGIREYRAEMSIHVLFLTDQQAFRVIFRHDGQPIDRSSITPAYGTVATSPYVVLGAR